MSEEAEPDLGPSTSGASRVVVDDAGRGRSGREAPRRRPSGAPPPLPHDLRRTGVGWLIAAVVVVVATVLIFRNGLHGAAIDVTVVDDTIVRWMSNLDLPGIDGIARGVSYTASWWAIQLTILALDVALIVFRRWRLLLIYLLVSQVALFVDERMYDVATVPRPFGVPLRGSWGGWSMPSVQMLALAGLSVIALYTLVPEGRLRNRLKWVVAIVVIVVALARLHLGVDPPSAIVVGVVISVSFAVTAFRFFAPSEVFPVTYRRGRAAHLDVGGARGEAIRRAVEDQLGLTVTEVQPVGLSGSAGSTPLRLRVDGASEPYLFGKLYSRTHLRSDRWYKLGRELLYGRLEDEKPFNTVRRLVQQEDYALRVIRDAGVPGARSYGFVELSPEREYLLVTEFLEGAVELGEAEVDEALIDEGLHLIRTLWNAGLAHRDIKPANVMVHDGHILLIDVAFAELRPTPWRQAVDLANMMLCLALRSSAQQVYDRALRQFTVEELTEAFAAAPRPGPPVAAAPGAARGGARPPRGVPPPAPRATPTHQGAALDLAAHRGRVRRRDRRHPVPAQRGPPVRERRRHPHPGARRAQVQRDGGDVAAGPSRAHRDARAVRGLVARGLVVPVADREQRAIDDHPRPRPCRREGVGPPLRPLV